MAAQLSERSGRPGLLRYRTVEAAFFPPRLGAPGLGPVVAAGWLAATAVGAAAGAATGGIVGALTEAGISREDVEEFVFALPPLAEQYRIVAKVDELIALCDRLEKSLASGEDIRRRLLDALLAEAVEPVGGDLEQAA